MNTETLIYKKLENIGMITLNRPDRLNAINSKMVEELGFIFDQLEKDESIHVAILTGGEKHFSVGADLKAERPPDFLQRVNKVFNRIEAFPKPLIAAINGYALGGGCELALCCDLRIASEVAAIGVPEAKIGVMPAAGGTYRLPRLVGVGKAKEILFGGNSINGLEAYRIGLVNKAVSAGKVLEEARQIAEKMLDNSPMALKAIKKCVNDGIKLDLGKAIEQVIVTADLLRASEDAQEGKQSFLEKRKPVWKGK